MEAVTKYQIEVDISTCDRIYDYGCQLWFDRPKSGWDYAELQRQSKLVSQYAKDVHYRKETAEQVLNMDITFQDDWMYNCLVRDTLKMLDSTKTYPTIMDLPLPERMFPVYRPGQIIQGHLVLELDKPYKAFNLRLKASGHTHVAVHLENNNSDDVGKEKYLENTIVYWQKTGTKYKLDDQSGMLTSSKHALPESLELPAGRHRFPFEFVVPVDTPNSCPSLFLDKASQMYVKYHLKATIGFGKMFGHDDWLMHEMLWVEGPVDLADHPEHLEPVCKVQQIQTGLFNTGKVTCTAKLPTRGYIRGDKIPLTLDIDNQSDSEIQKIKVRVTLKGNARAKTGFIHPRMAIHLRGPKIIEGRLRPHASQCYNVSVPVDFSELGYDNNLIPTDDGFESKIATYRYELEIDVIRNGVRRNIVMRIPLFLGSVNSTKEVAGK